MNFIEKLLDSAGFIKKIKSSFPGVLSSNTKNPFSIWAQQKKIDPGRALEVYTGWVYAAIRAIAMEVSGMEYKLFRTTKDKDTQIFEHELLDILSGINDYQTGIEFLYTIAAHLEITGNAYVYLEGCKSDTDKPIALHTMIPSKVTVQVDRELFPARIEGYEYRLGSHVYSFKPYQVLHIKYVDPSDPYEGIGTVQAEAQWIDADNHAMEFNRRYFLNGARVGGFIESESAYTPEQLQYLKSSFESAFKGVENAYKVLALPKGTSYKEGAQTQKDMDFPNLSLTMQNRIIAGFKTPKTALGITDDVNRANAEATDYVFAARTIKPIMKIIVSYLNEFLVPRYGDDLYLDFVDPVPEDRMQKIDERFKALGGAPWRSVNEVREEEGLEPIRGGDAVQAPFNFTPVGSPDSQPKQSRPASVKAIKKHKSRFGRNSELRRSISKTIASQAAEGISNLLKDIDEIKKNVQKNITQLSDDEYEKVWKGFAMRVTSYEKKERMAVQDFNSRQKKEVLSNLPKILKEFVQAQQKAIKKADLFDMDQNMAAFVDLSEPILFELAGKEGAEAAALLGIGELDILSPSVRRALDRSIQLLSNSYNDTTRELLKDKLEQGLREGLSQDELADLVNGVYEYSDDVRAIQVARTETFRIANYATQEAWKQSGIVKSQRWYTAADERVCPYCSPIHGKVVSIDEDFYKKGDTVTGSDGSELSVEYSNVGAPPLHVSCRCYIRPEQITLE